MNRRVVARTLTVLGLTLGLSLLAACGGGDDVKSSASPGASSTTTLGGGSTSNANSGLAEAGPELSAYHLLDAAGYAAALGEPVTAIEDDGVFPQQYVCEISQARVLTSTSGAILSLLLITSDSAQSAQNAYQTYSSSAFGNGTTPTPIAGAGDKAGYSNGTAVILKGSQVLQITGQAGPDAQAKLDAIKSNGGDPTSAYAAILTAAQKLAPGVAAKMSGKACSGTPAFGIPEGALDPCVTRAADIEAALGITGVTVTNVLSDSPPSLECQYGLGSDGTFVFYTTTQHQLQASIQPKTAAERFAADQLSATAPLHASDEVETFVGGPFQGFGSMASRAGIDDELLVQSSGAATQNIRDSTRQVIVYQAEPTLPPTPFGDIILKILEDASDGLIKPADCEPFMHVAMLAFFHGLNNIFDYPPDAPYFPVEDKLVRHCFATATKAVANHR